MKKLVMVTILLVSFSSFAFAARLYMNDFEGETLGQPPQGWELGFVGNGEGKVIVDPVDPGNQVFAQFLPVQDQDIDEQSVVPRSEPVRVS